MENTAVSPLALTEWLKKPENKDNAKYLPDGISYELSNFEQFMEERQKLMSDALKDILT